MTRIVIVGEMFYSDLSVGGGPMPGGGGQPSHPIHYPGSPSHPIYNPAYPDQGLPGGQPYPDQGLPGVPPGFWGGQNPHPDQGLPGGSGGSPSHPWVPPGNYPDQGLPGGGQGSGTPVPEDVYQPAPVPEEIASQFIVSVYSPKTMEWTTKSYPPR
jgi:hypothetical protein